MTLRIDDERPGDAAAIATLIERAFAGADHGGGNEAEIVAALRRAGALALSLVARLGEERVGHAAWSAVVTDGQSEGWFGLGPVAVAPEHQRRGIGAALISSGLERLRAAGAKGSVVVGDPAFYGGFGFRPDSALSFADVPQPYLQSLSFGEERPRGELRYHPAFGLRLNG